MGKHLLILMPLFILIFSCGKGQRGKRAYQNGDYRKAVTFLEAALQKNQNDEKAKRYLVLARSGLLTERSSRFLAANEFGNALVSIDQALSLDPKNKTARKIFEGSVEKISKHIEQKLIPDKAWPSIVKLSALILKYKPNHIRLAPIHAEAVFHAENDVLNAPAVLAIEKAYSISPENAFLREKHEIVVAKTSQFRKLFESYQSALIEEDYGTWKSLIHPRHLKEAQADVKRLAEGEDENIQTVRDYFFEISQDPQKYGNPDGAEIVCVEPLSSTHAFIHFRFSKLPKILKMEVTMSDGRLKLHREEDSEINKSDLL